jgi:L-ascorbate metabolism protein UlaG (beta-lactamase superfamily)
VNAPLLSREPRALPLEGGGAGPGLGLYWLGQAGFLLETGSSRILIDPYLSDSLAAKYRGTARPHIRMRPAPADPGSLRDIDLVLASHGHGDHLDPGSLGPLAAANPQCLFVAPASCAALAKSRGVPADRLVEADAFVSFEAAGLTVHALPSAHEELEIDDHGRHLALGYVIEAGGFVVYHSGDCAPYPGLEDNLAPFAVDLGLLPVNGRDPERRAAGILGNFSLEEAMALAQRARFGAAIGHHFGMFDFNTVDEGAARSSLAARRGDPPFILAEEGLRYSLAPRGARPDSGGRGIRS